jgi:glycosyltransferase involved in cell wall biosynthesis
VIRLGVDATAVGPRGKGIARVQRGTVRALADLGRFDLVVFARHPDELGPRAVPVRARPAIVWEQVGVPVAYRRHRLDALLTWSERVPLVGGGRRCVWLFEPPRRRIDMNRRIGAGWWQRGSDLLTLALWKRSLRRASVVFTGSIATAEEIRAVAPSARALYPGLDPAFSARGDGDAHQHHAPYVLHLASSDPRDDTATALEAARRAGVRLVVAGSYSGARDGVDVVGRVSDAELVDLYRGASAFLDTSLYEGFGYQVLEAMACGAPVVASDTTSIPEVAGGAALLCPPRDAGAFADALQRVVRDEALARDLRERGFVRAAEFTWERTARELATAIEEVVR